MMFAPQTRLPLEALGPLAQLKARYCCGPVAALDDAQRALLAAFEGLMPRAKFQLLDAAAADGRDYLSGADVTRCEKKSTSSPNAWLQSLKSDCRADALAAEQSE